MLTKGKIKDKIVNTSQNRGHLKLQKILAHTVAKNNITYKNLCRGKVHYVVPDGHAPSPCP